MSSHGTDDNAMKEVALEEGKLQACDGGGAPTGSPDGEGLAANHPRKVLKGYSQAGGLLREELEEDAEGVRRSGGVWSTFFLVITAVIGSGVLSLSYSVAMLGWVAGIALMLLFAWITLYTSQLLADCHIVDGRRTRSYIEQVGLVLGRRHRIIIAWVQQSNLVLTALAYSITATYAMVNVATSVCEGQGVEEGRCFNTFWKWALIHGGMQITFSYIPDMDSSIWPCVVGAAMSICYSCISLGRSIAEGSTHGTVAGITDLSTSAKTFGVMNAFGAILFAYSFSMILPEIQDTIRDGVKGGPIKAMRKTVNWSVGLMTSFYLAVAISGYMAYGNEVAGNILDSFQTPRWLVDCANIMVIVHLLPAYQVWSQPFFFYVESSQRAWWGKRGVPRPFRGWAFRAWFRPAYVCFITFLTILMPFFSYIIGLVGALGFWPASVYYPIEMWIRLYKPSALMWRKLQALNLLCLLCSLVALIGSVQSIVVAWTTFCFLCEN